MTPSHRTGESKPRQAKDTPEKRCKGRSEVEGGREGGRPTDQLGPDTEEKTAAAATATTTRLITQFEHRRRPPRDRNGIISRARGAANKGGCFDRQQLVEVSRTKRVRCRDWNQLEE